MLLSIAWRNLWRHRTRSLAIIASVALGVWAGLFITSFYYGMGESRMRTVIQEEVSHLRVRHPRFNDDFEAGWNFSLDSMEQVIRQTPGVKAFSLRAVAQGMIATAAGSNGVQINGIDPAAETATRQLEGFVKEGSYFDTDKVHQALVGKKLATKMNLKPGAKIVLTFSDAAQNIHSGAFRICGIYETQNAPLDERNVYVQRTALNDLLGTPGRGTEAAILLHDGMDVQTAQQTLQNRLPGLETLTWRETSPETALVMSSLDMTSLIFIVIIMLALAFGIVNTMLMAVLERTREIGMLMAIGMTRLRVFGMVVIETLLLSMVGCPAGVALAFALNARLSVKGIDFSVIAGNTMKDFGYEAIIYPEIPAFKVWQVVQVVFFIALFASVFPAWKALRLQPAEAIRQ